MEELAREAAADKRIDALVKTQVSMITGPGATTDLVYRLIPATAQTLVD